MLFKIRLNKLNNLTYLLSIPKINWFIFEDQGQHMTKYHDPYNIKKVISDLI